MSPNVHYGNAQKPEKDQKAAAERRRRMLGFGNPVKTISLRIRRFFRLIFIAQLRYEANISDLLISIYNKIFIYGCICLVTQTAEKSLEFSACNICIFIHF